MSLIFPELAEPRRALPLGDKSTLDLVDIPRQRENSGSGCTRGGSDARRRIAGDSQTINGARKQSKRGDQPLLDDRVERL